MADKTLTFTQYEHEFLLRMCKRAALLAEKIPDFDMRYKRNLDVLQIKKLVKKLESHV